MKVVRIDRRVLGALLILTVSLPAAAQQLDLSALEIAVASGSLSDANSAEQQAVRSSIIVWLDRRGADPFEIGENIARFDEPVAGSLARARATGSDLLIIANVETEDSRLTTALQLYDVASGTLLAIAESEDEVGLTFDRVVGELTGTLLSSAEATITALIAQKKQNAVGSDTGVPSEPDESGQGDPPQTGDQSDHGSLAAGDSPQSSDPAGRSGSSSSQERSRPLPGAEPQPAASVAPGPLWSFRLGLSPQAPVYESAGYLGFSWGASVHAALFPRRNGLWAVGLAGRAILSQATGASASAQVLTVPFGTTVELSPRLDPIAPVVRLTVGAAYMRATNEQLGVFTSIVPYGALDLATLLPLTEVISLELGLGIEVLVEGSIALIGLYPALSVSLDL